MTETSTTPKQVVSLVGPTCVGKGTLAYRLSQDIRGVRERFGIDGEMEFYCRKTKTRCDGLQFRKRHEMFQPPHPAVIIFKWQYRDENLIEMLCEAFPKAKHRAIVCWRPLNQRLASARQQFRGKNERQEVRLWRKNVRDKFSHGKEVPKIGVHVELVDASTKEYAPLENWPDG